MLVTVVSVTPPALHPGDRIEVVYLPSDLTAPRLGSLGVVREPPAGDDSNPALVYADWSDGSDTPLDSARVGWRRLVAPQ